MVKYIIMRRILKSILIQEEPKGLMTLVNPRCVKKIKKIVGEDGKGFAYSGNSAIINPKGESVSNIPENENCTETIIISLGELNTFRKVFPVGMDADEFEITH